MLDPPEARPELPRQQTLAAAAELEGVGLHTGCRARLRLVPAAPGEGIRFVTPHGLVPATGPYRVASTRCTALAAGDATVQTPEHLLAALYGCGIDNLRIEIEGPEVPALDGSALPFVEAILSAGIAPQEAPATVLHLAGPVWVGAGEKHVIALPAPVLAVTAAIDFARPLAGPGIFSFVVPGEEADGAAVQQFAGDLAPARTFCFADEVEALLNAGLGAGGSLENVIVVSNTGTSTPLRFPDELARHKALDLLGDLALLGARLAAHVIAVKGSHSLHGAAVDEIRRTAHAED
jgi:UDP-3-O-[3-hydroxymyristoyl] N-acetylglucosamine deacetylase